MSNAPLHPPPTAAELATWRSFAIRDLPHDPLAEMYREPSGPSPRTPLGAAALLLAASMVALRSAPSEPARSDAPQRAFKQVVASLRLDGFSQWAALYERHETLLAQLSWALLGRAQLHIQHPDTTKGHN